ncbi:hypothetical protein DCC81_01255 [Chitinophaga parva]|uniref:J domain-containing protein n=2 Tax=Chitinophaga parva TaxID=2169414 RepID=A0A2T7BKD8_9BACT|nr:hypothetical protein DCC81_01255 [Chitinophaga parva]
MDVKAPMSMITDDRAYEILQVEKTASSEEILEQYEQLKLSYKKMREETEDLRTKLACQLKQIELDDAFLYLKKIQKI